MWASAKRSSSLFPLISTKNSQLYLISSENSLGELRSLFMKKIFSLPFRCSSLTSPFSSVHPFLVPPAFHPPSRLCTSLHISLFHEPREGSGDSMNIFIIHELSLHHESRMSDPRNVLWLSYIRRCYLSRNWFFCLLHALGLEPVNGFELWTGRIKLLLRRLRHIKASSAPLLAAIFLHSRESRLSQRIYDHYLVA